MVILPYFLPHRAQVWLRSRLYKEFLYLPPLLRPNRSVSSHFITSCWLSNNRPLGCLLWRKASMARCVPTLPIMTLRLSFCPQKAAAANALPYSPYSNTAAGSAPALSSKRCIFLRSSSNLLSHPRATDAPSALPQWPPLKGRFRSAPWWRSSWTIFASLPPVYLQVGTATRALPYQTTQAPVLYDQLL